MADKIPVYGELDCRTAENIIADAEQIRYDATKNVKEVIDDKMSNPSNTGTVGQVLKKTVSGSEWADESGGGDAGITTIKYTTSVFTGSKDLEVLGTREVTLKLYPFSANNTTLSDVLELYGTGLIGSEVTSATLTYKHSNGQDIYLDVIKCAITREENTFKRIIRVTYRYITEVTSPSAASSALSNKTYETVFYEEDNTSFTYVDIA